MATYSVHFGQCCCAEDCCEERALPIASLINCICFSKSVMESETEGPSISEVEESDVAMLCCCCSMIYEMKTGHLTLHKGRV